jgi:hypothetical protein
MNKTDVDDELDVFMNIDFEGIQLPEEKQTFQELIGDVLLKEILDLFSEEEFSFLQEWVQEHVTNYE